MSLEELSAIGQIVGGIGVVASLIFVGLQIRQNTRVNQAQIREHIISDWASVANILMMHPNVFAVGIAGTVEEYNALTSEQKLTFNTQAFLIFKHYENMFLQYDAGFLNDTTWATWSTHALMYFHQRGIQAWWKERRIAYAPSFRDFLEASAPPPMASQAEMFNRKPGSPKSASS